MAGCILAAGLVPCAPSSPAPPPPPLQEAPAPKAARPAVAGCGAPPASFEEALGPSGALEEAPAALPSAEEESAKELEPGMDLYEEAEAIRLKTPPPTPRCSPAKEELSLRVGLAVVGAKHQKVPATESLLFPGLTLTGGRSGARRRPEEQMLKPSRLGCATPTTASHTHVPSSAGVAGGVRAPAPAC